MGYSCFAMLCKFMLIRNVNQLFTYPLFSGFPSHLGRHGAFSRVLCAIHTYILYIVSIVCICMYRCIVYVKPNLAIPSHHPSPSCYPYICSLCLCLYFCLASKFTCMIFLDSTYKGYLFIFLSDLLHSV